MIVYIRTLNRIMLLNPQLALDVIAAWKFDQNHPHRGRIAKPILNEAEMYTLLDTVFGVSLLREEGRPAQTSVTWVSKQSFNSHEIPQFRESPLTLEFDPLLDFEAHSLAKLSGIVNGKTSTLLVSQSDAGPKIWGICYFAGRTGPLAEIPATTPEVLHRRPDYPTFLVTGVGSMSIIRGHTIIGRIEGGKFLRSEATVLTSYMLGHYLYSLINVEVDLKTRHFKNPSDQGRSQLFLSCIEFIIEVLSQRRAGATIIIVPTEQKAVALAEASSPWAAQGSLEIGRLQDARINYSKQAQKSKDSAQTLFRLVINQALRTRLRSLVDLAGVDGALLLTPSFDVIGFGMKLKSLKWDRNVNHGPVVQPIEKQSLNFSRLGTRHNSALNFVGKVSGAVAFVASSDGPIRALVKTSEDNVWYWPDCRVSMFAS